ncbi:TPA: hypothetical protein NNM78_001930 [Pseudomonas aeruginosa]|nr:hypothetical protein [Pseudomonas aeruginosa]
MSADLKAQAKRLRAYLDTLNIRLTHSQALEAIAAVHGFKDWNTAVAADDKATHAALGSDYSPLPGVGVTRPVYVAVSEDHTEEMLRDEVLLALRNDPETLILRVDSTATVAHIMMANRIVEEFEGGGTRLVVDGLAISFG